MSRSARKAKYTADQLASLICDESDSDFDYDSDVLHEEIENGNEILSDVEETDDVLPINALVQLPNNSEYFEDARDPVVVTEDGDNPSCRPTSDYEDSNSDSESDIHVDPAFEAIPDEYFSKSGRKWIKVLSSERGRPPLVNIVTLRPGVVPGVTVETEKMAFWLYFRDILDKVTYYTNLEGRRLCALPGTSFFKRHWKKVSRDEIDCFVGIYILAGVYRQHYRNIHDLFDPKRGFPAFRAAMSRTRFEMIKTAFRFDDRRRPFSEGVFAKIEEIWTMFMQKLKQFYNPNPELCIDEQLLEFHGRVAFRQYIATKPGKFGIKIFWLTDATNSYALGGIPYVGKETTNSLDFPNISTFSDKVSIELLRPFLNRGYNVTADNYFTSATLMEYLLEKNTTYVGTFRRNRRELPSVAARTSKLAKGTTNYYRSGKILLVAFTDKRATLPVLLGSSMHKAILNDVSEKPQVVNDYNKHKSGVDNLDHKVRIFSSKRKSCRWTMAFFFNMVDIALVNAHVLFSETAEKKSDLISWKTWLWH